jgi:lipoprotein-releasing system permease protein
VPRWLPFTWIAAIRFLVEGRMQSLFITAGVAIGVAVIVFMSALLTGIQANTMRRVLNAQPHIVIDPPDEIARPLRGGDRVTAFTTVQRPAQRLRSIDQWQAIETELRRRPDVTNVAPTAAGSALAIRGEASRAITLTGIDPEQYFKIVKLPENIVAGQPRLSSEDIIVGAELAKNLGVTVGDKLRVTAGTGRQDTLTITGIFDLGSRGVNERNAYVALRTAQSLLDLIGGVTSLNITVADVYAAERIALEIQAQTGIEADSWIKTNAQFFTAMNSQKTSSMAIRFFVGLSVAFGIASVLVVSVVQRSKEIGILRAMGAARRQILRLFLIQGGVLGLTGSVFGAALGAAALRLWHAYARAPDGTELFPLAMDPWLFVAAVALATVTGVVAAMTPALRAARLDPVVAIRG